MSKSIECEKFVNVTRSRCMLEKYAKDDNYANLTLTGITAPKKLMLTFCILEITKQVLWQ